MITKQNYVTFYSPGTFVSEATTKPIDQWSPVVACAMMHSIVERYGAKPYAFRFSTRTEASPISDGSGGSLDVASRTDETSPMYHINAVIDTVEDVERRADPRESILLSNMRCNGFSVAITINSFKHCAPFESGDRAVDLLGNVTVFG